MGGVLLACGGLELRMSGTDSDEALMMSYWTLHDSPSGQYLEHDGYDIDVRRLNGAPGFWVRQIAGKTWGTPYVLGGLAAWAVRLGGNS